MMYVEYGKKMRVWRKGAGFTQKELAAELGLDVAQTVSNVERGIAGYGFHQTKKLATLFRVNPEVIFGSLLDAKAKMYRDQAGLN